ncbi:MAG: hypothetical protein ACO1N0_11615 [Fluviicola sp.]
MKCFTILAFVFLFSLTNAQTPLIAHKSHAGVSISYLIDPSSNFGVIRLSPKQDFETWEKNSLPQKTEVFIPLNDSVILKRTTSGISIGLPEIKTDTLSNKKRYSVFEFQHKYQDSVRKEKLVKWSFQYAAHSLNQPSAPIKKKKKSYLLFLFGITGGGLLFMQLFRSSKSIQPAIS